MAILFSWQRIKRLSLLGSIWLCACSSQPLSSAELQAMAIVEGGDPAAVVAALQERGYRCTQSGPQREFYDCVKTSGFMPTCVLRVEFKLDQAGRLKQVRVPAAACIGTP